MNLPSLKDNPIFYLGILITIEQAIGQGSVSLAHLVPASWAPAIQGWCTLFAFVGTAIMTALAAPGRVPAAPAAKVMAWLAVGGLALMLFASPALAQTKKRAPLTGNPVQDIQNAISGTPAAPGVEPGDKLGQLLAKPFQDLANFIANDLASAIALSTAIPSLQDGHGQQCFIAMQAFGDVVKAHPIPVTFHAATDLEALRLAQMAANNLCGNPHCTQVFADLATTVQTAAPVNVSIPIPSLHDLCSKVPQIAVAAPVSVPAPTAPAPSSGTSAAPATTPAAPAPNP